MKYTNEEIKNHIDRATKFEDDGWYENAGHIALLAIAKMMYNKESKFE